MTLEELVSILDVKEIGPQLFEGRSPAQARGRIFGGQSIAQGLAAASHTAAERTPHSLHLNFITAGNDEKPVQYRVTSLLDGRSFAMRRCDAFQEDKLIFTLTVSFQAPEVGFDHQIAMPTVLRPDELMANADWLKDHAHVMQRATDRYFSHTRPVEFCPVELERYFEKPQRVTRSSQQTIWLRLRHRLPDQTHIHRAALGWMSDMTLLDTALVPHGHNIFDPEIRGASLDHALWFHRPFRADDWLLFSTEAITTVNGRGLVRGHFFTTAGTLVASTCQEGVLRKRAP
jgi:acyl-CoA thioesterase-2